MQRQLGIVVSLSDYFDLDMSNRCTVFPLSMCLFNLMSLSIHNDFDNIRPCNR